MKEKRRNASFILGIFVLFMSMLGGAPCESFTVSRYRAPRRSQQQHLPKKHYFSRLAAVSSSQEVSSSSNITSGYDDVSIRTYEYDGWTLSYRYKPAAPGYKLQAPLLLIHPVGIGLSSWFWNKFLAEWQGPAVYAPDLIGCGVKNGGSPYIPQERGLFFPLGWVQGCEALMQQQVLNALPLPGSVVGQGANGWNVICQGGLAPIGVLLAARNPTTVSSLVLTSPPTWSEMTTAIPEAELSRNYDFLTNPLIEPLAFGLLETRWAIRFFSNLFLFANGDCDDEWLDLACNEIAIESRPPIAVFNAGFCNHRSFRQELETLQQPALILSGDDDKRVAGREEYQPNMQDCTMESLPGQNVLPWESPELTCKAVKKFCYEREAS